MILPLFLCGVAAAEIVAQPSICIDPPPQSSNSSLRSRKKNGRVNNELSAYNVFRGAIDGGRATVWNVERAYRAGRGRGCRVGGRGVYHDHALCRRARIGAATT